MSIQTINVDREEASGTLNGSYYGPHITVLARNDDAVLFWSGAYSTTNNGFPRYSEAGLHICRNRNSFHYSDNKTLHYGGRLNKDLIFKFSDLIDEVFGAGITIQIADVFRTKTVLVDGGGEPLRPSRRRQFGVQKRTKYIPSNDVLVSFKPEWIVYLSERLSGVNDPVGQEIAAFLATKQRRTSRNN